MAATSCVVMRHHLKKTQQFTHIIKRGSRYFCSVPSHAGQPNNKGMIDESNETVDTVVQYPRIKPKYPPGNWGSMNHKYAWLWQKTKDELLNLPDVKSRQDYLTSREMKVVPIPQISDHPDALQFGTYVTKTCLLPWDQHKPHLFRDENKVQEGVESDPTPSSRSSSITDWESKDCLANIKDLLIGHILMEHHSIERGKLNTNNVYTQREKYCNRILHCVANALTTYLSHEHEHLRTCQYDEDVLVRALWDRHGISRKRKRRTGMDDNFLVDEVQDHRIISSCKFDGMLRSHLPLPQFEQRDGGLSLESDTPTLPYKHSIFGAAKSRRNLKNILAGHNLGDPCEYGLVGLLSTVGIKHIEEISSRVAQDCRLNMGITRTFTWLAAQAYNQGFSGYIDLTYPLTSQTVLSDGKNFSFLMYQLNTLELWKDNDANKMVNLCWHTEEMPLYESIDQGKVIGFNDEVLKMLIRVFTLAPSDRGYDMKPTIQDKEMDLHLKQDFIRERVEVIVEEEEEQYIIQ